MASIHPTERPAPLNVLVPESLLAIAKVAAAERGTTLGALVVEGLASVAWPLDGSEEA
jgi:hypothetical protein